MIKNKPSMLTLVFTMGILVVPVAALGKAACELKQLLSDDEFETVQSKWNVDHPLPKAQDAYKQIKPDDEIYFYDTKSLSFKNDAILRWRKSDGNLTIKNRSGSGDTSDAKCQIDFVSEANNSSKNSCQYDTESKGPSPNELEPSKVQKAFLEAKHLQWDASQLIQMGPIHSYQTSVGPTVCDGLGDKTPIEFESWIMEKIGGSKMVYEVSVKVKDADKCVTRNQAFRSCLSKAGVNVSKERGTKTETVYEFFQ